MKKQIRCAIYTRKSTEEGLELNFNSLDAQREACESYIKSQAHEGWVLVKKQYNDGGYSGGTMERPAFKELLEDIKNNKIDIVVVYKVDRLTRSLMDFSKIIEIFDQHNASFVSITQHFNTTTSSSGNNKRLRKLRFLPPEMIEAIMNGTQDPELNVKKLIVIANEYVE
ncbi:recombinase family protein [bacterium]|nr:recombinase family protein [bacterium]